MASSMKSDHPPSPSSPAPSLESKRNEAREELDRLSQEAEEALQKQVSKEQVFDRIGLSLEQLGRELLAELVGLRVEQVRKGCIKKALHLGSFGTYGWIATIVLVASWLFWTPWLLLVHAGAVYFTYRRLMSAEIRELEELGERDMNGFKTLKLVFVAAPVSDEEPNRFMCWIGPTKSGYRMDLLNWVTFAPAPRLAIRGVYLTVVDSSETVCICSRGFDPQDFLYVYNNPYFLEIYREQVGQAFRKHLPRYQGLVKEWTELADGLASVILTSSTLEKAVQARAEEERIEQIWDDIILPGETKQAMLKRIHMFNAGDPAAPRGLLLYGPPGTGKTFLAQKIAASTRSHFVELSLPDLKASHIGESGQRVRAIWDEARQHPRSIIFIDECEGVLSRRGDVDSDKFSNDIVQAFLAEWDGMKSTGRTWVIGATNRRELLDEAIVSRFGAEIEIALPSKEARAQILKNELLKVGVTAPPPAFMADATQGMSGRDLKTLAQQVRTDAYPGMPTDQHYRRIAEQIKKRGGIAVDEEATWDRLVLAPATKELLVSTASLLQYAESAEKQGISVPRGILLYGPPGTGKTQIARTLANESHLQFVAASTADLKAGFIGQSGQRVKAVFERARASAPAILFIDEIETVAPARGGGGGDDQFTREIVAQLLQELDGVKASTARVFLLAATNLIDQVDPAILSRLPQKLEIPLPTPDGRRDILRVLLSGRPIRFDLEEGLSTLARSTEGKSGRDLRSMVEDASQRAFMRALRQGHPDGITIELDDFGLSSAPALAPGREGGGGAGQQPGRA